MEEGERERERKEAAPSAAAAAAIAGREGGGGVELGSSLATEHYDGWLLPLSQLERERERNLHWKNWLERF